MMKVCYRSEKMERREKDVPYFVLCAYLDLRRDELNYCHGRADEYGWEPHNNVVDSRWYVPTYEGEVEDYRRHFTDMQYFLEMIDKTRVLARGVFIDEIPIYDERGNRGIIRDYLAKIRERAQKLTKDEEATINKTLQSYDEMAKAIPVLWQLLDRVERANFDHYAAMCGGVHPKNNMYAELVKLKRMTAKVLRFVPEMAEFADNVDASREMLRERCKDVDHYFSTYNWRKGLKSELERQYGIIHRN